jgi:hypothetical protein
VATLGHIFLKYGCEVRTSKAFLKTNFLVIFSPAGVCVCVRVYVCVYTLTHTHTHTHTHICIYTHKVACGGAHYKKPKHLVILYNEAFFVNKMLRWTELSLFF